MCRCADALMRWCRPQARLVLCRSHALSWKGSGLARSARARARSRRSRARPCLERARIWSRPAPVESRLGRSGAQVVEAGPTLAEARPTYADSSPRSVEPRPYVAQMSWEFAHSGAQSASTALRVPPDQHRVTTSSALQTAPMPAVRVCSRPGAGIFRGRTTRIIICVRGAPGGGRAHARSGVWSVGLLGTSPEQGHPRQASLRSEAPLDFDERTFGLVRSRKSEVSEVWELFPNSQGSRMSQFRRNALSIVRSRNYLAVTSSSKNARACTFVFLLLSGRIWSF